MLGNKTQFTHLFSFGHELRTGNHILVKPKPADYLSKANNCCLL